MRTLKTGVPLVPPMFDGDVDTPAIFGRTGPLTWGADAIYWGADAALWGGSTL